MQTLNILHIDVVCDNRISTERTFIVFMDEAFFAGNRRAADELKSVVTEPTILINEKHQPSRQMNSNHRSLQPLTPTTLRTPKMTIDAISCYAYLKLTRAI